MIREIFSMAWMLICGLAVGLLPRIGEGRQ